jgi:uncharacterized phage protein (TIGR01671 family)
MRGIKFRAWDSDERKILRPPVEFQQLLRQISSLIDNSIGGDAIRTHSLEWMQFTGLKDKNGVEIYEDDIVLMDVAGHSPIQGLVTNSITHDGEFRSDRGLPGDYFLSAWGVEYRDGGFAAFCHYNRPYDYAEIIGNVYEHPQLLEQAKVVTPD